MTNGWTTFLGVVVTLKHFQPQRAHIRICESISSTTLPFDTNLNTTDEGKDLFRAWHISNSSHIDRFKLDDRFDCNVELEAIMQLRLTQLLRKLPIAFDLRIWKSSIMTIGTCIPLYTTGRSHFTPWQSVSNDVCMNYPFQRNSTVYTTVKGGKTYLSLRKEDY